MSRAPDSVLNRIQMRKLLHVHWTCSKLDASADAGGTCRGKLLDRSEFDVYHQELMYTDADQLRGVRD